MRISALLTLLFCILILPLSRGEAGTEFYRWVDSDGKEFFTNDPKQIPAEYRDRATVVNPDESRVSVADKPFSGRTGAFEGEHRDKHGKGEEYWHRRAENLRLKLRDQQQEHDHVVKQLEEQERKSAAPGAKKKSTAGLDKKKVKLEKDMAKTRRMLEVDLPEEARRAGAYPGWIRE